MAEQPEHDSLRELFSGVELPPADPSRREAIFAATQGVLRTRRIVRRAFWGMNLAACYVLGVLSVLGWQAMNPGPVVAIRAGQVPDQSPQTIPTEELKSAPGTSPEPAAESSSEALPLVASAAEPVENTPPQPVKGLSTFEKLRRAGDRQLNERGNLKGAIACYRRALEFAGDDELVIVPDRDSWLLMSLKESHSQERKHVHKKS